jgi:hypothetical protein
VQVVRRCAVSTSAPEPQDGGARIVVEATCGNAARVMVDLSMRAASEKGPPSVLKPTGEPIFLQPPAIPHVEGIDRDLTTVLTVHF